MSELPFYRGRLGDILLPIILVNLMYAVSSCEHEIAGTNAFRIDVAAWLFTS